MPIPTTSQYVNEQWRFLMFPNENTEIQPTKQHDSDEIKLTNGKPTYRIPVVAVNRANGRQETGVSLKVFNKPSELKESLDLKVTGNVLITPWVNNGRIAYSITADGISYGDK